MLKKTLITTCIALSIWTSSAFATDLQAYEQVKEDEAFLLYLYGVGTGMQFYNATSELQYGIRLYCPPPLLNFTPDLFASVLDQEMMEYKAGKRPKYKKEMPIAAILIVALMNTFPCAAIGG